MGGLKQIIRFAPSLADLLRLRARRIRFSFLQSRGSSGLICRQSYVTIQL